MGEGSLNDWDEAIYAEIAREMNKSSDWITPHWNGFPLHDKPPLIFWLMALGLKLTASAEFAVRLPAAIAGFCSVLLVMVLGRVLFCAWIGMAAAILLLFSSEDWPVNFVMLSRQGMLDVPLTAFTLWIYLHLVLGLQRPCHWLLMGVPLGLAILTKSLLVLPIVSTIFVVASIAWWSGKPIVGNWRYAAGGVLVAIAIFLPWHIVELFMHGRDFIDGYILIHLAKIGRAESDNVGGPAFYIDKLIEALPYLVWLVIPAICLVTWRALRVRDFGSLLLLVWIVLPIAMLSAIATKLPWYIVPTLPALFLAIAVLLRSAVPRHWLIEMLTLSMLIIAVGLWNRATLRPINYSWDVKALGDCAVRVTPVDDQIAYYNPDWNKTSYPDPRPLLNIRPSVLVYTKAPMISIRDFKHLERWIDQGGQFLWTEKNFAKQLPSSYTLIAKVGEQEYYYRNGSTGFLPGCK